MIRFNKPLREIVIEPYRPGGPAFKLTIWDTNRVVFVSGKRILRYELVERDGVAEWLIFAGNDFECSPMHAVDSNETALALLGFLCLRPGDTDYEHFAKYNQTQAAFAEVNAEAVYSCASAELITTA